MMLSLPQSWADQLLNRKRAAEQGSAPEADDERWSLACVPATRLSSQR